MALKHRLSALKDTLQDWSRERQERTELKKDQNELGAVRKRLRSLEALETKLVKHIEDLENDLAELLEARRTVNEAKQKLTSVRSARRKTEARSDRLTQTR